MTNYGQTSMRMNLLLKLITPFNERNKMKMKKYNPKQNYYFIDYGLEERGHPEYIKEMKKEDPSHRDMGCPRWVRSSFNTEQDVQETMNFVFQPYPHIVKRLQIRSEEELNKIVTIEEKTNKILYEGDDGFEKGFKFTQREYDFGGYYQSLYEKRLMLDYCPPHPCDQEEEKEQNRT